MSVTQCVYVCTDMLYCTLLYCTVLAFFKLLLSLIVFNRINCFYLFLLFSQNKTDYISFFQSPSNPDCTHYPSVIALQTSKFAELLLEELLAGRIFVNKITFKKHYKP